MKLALLALLLGCGGGGGDWTTRPVKPVTAQFNGKSFTIDLPEGMRQRTTKWEVEWDFLEGDRVKTPNVTVSDTSGWKTLDDYERSHPKVEKWVRKDALPDGFIAVHENDAYPGKEDYIVYVVKGGWGCSVRVSPWSRGDSVADKLPAVGQMCLSLKPAK